MSVGTSSARGLRFDHAALHAGVREHLQAQRRIPVAEQAEQRRHPDVRIATDMIRIAAGIDDHAESSVRGSACVACHVLPKGDADLGQLRRPHVW